MPDIRYVCMSDMHFGADNSVLTNIGNGNGKVDPWAPSPVLEALVDCLRAAIATNSSSERPRLILNGDIFEFALAPDNMAAMAFQRFVELAMPSNPSERLFDDEIWYVPGNHDHHLWEAARETQYANFLLGPGRGQRWIPDPWHATKMVQPGAQPGVYGVPSTFADAVIHKCPGLSFVRFLTFYPNLGIISPKNQRLAIFSHGHFTENIYTLMTSLADLLHPERTKGNAPWDLEAENFAWIDFFWSTVGRSGGGIGVNVEQIYEMMQDTKKFSEFAGDAAKALSEKYAPAIWPGVGSLLALLVRRLVGGKLERSHPDKPLSDNGEGLRRYIETAIREQLVAEMKQSPEPEEVTFVFGHTHKPFEEMIGYAGYPRPVCVYNSGGWVVDRPTACPVYGGAVILLDENLNSVALRMYDESERDEEYRVRVAAAGESPSSNPLLARMLCAIQPAAPQWRRFSTAAAQAVRLHTRMMPG